MAGFTTKCRRDSTIKWRDKLKEQRKLGKNCDMKLIVNDEEILVHRCVLAASNSYFKTLFDAEVKEKDSKILDISETFESAEILRKIIGFIYGESIIFSAGNVECLLHYSDFLNLSEITKHGLKFLLKNLTFKNCLHTWFLADRFGFTELKEVCSEIAECNFDIIIKFETTLTLSAKDLLTLLKIGLAKHMNYSQVEKFIDSYINYDVEMRKDFRADMLAAYIEGQKGTIQQSQAASLVTTDEYDEAVMIQSTSSHIWLIYSLKDNCWYSGDHIYKALRLGQRITNVGIGPHCDYIMTAPENELLSAWTMTVLHMSPKLPVGPQQNRPNCQMYTMMHTRNYKELFGVCWFTSKNTFFVPLVEQAEEDHGFYLYQFDLRQLEWIFVQTVYETNQVVECFHVVQSGGGNLYILVVQPKCIQLFHFAALSRKLVQLKTFTGDAYCRPRWEIFANKNVMILWNEQKEKSLHYSFHSNQWSVHKRIKLCPTELEKGTRKFDIVAMSKNSGKIFIWSTRQNITKTLFVSYDPIMKETVELCPLPIDSDKTSQELLQMQWQMVPRKFFSYLKPAMYKTTQKKKLLSAKLVEECFSRYQRRINNEPEEMDDDEEEENIFSIRYPRCPPQNFLEAMQEEIIQQMVTSTT